MFVVSALEGSVHRITTDSIARSMRDMLMWGQHSKKEVHGYKLKFTYVHIYTETAVVCVLIIFLFLNILTCNICPLL